MLHFSQYEIARRNLHPHTDHVCERRRDVWESVRGPAGCLCSMLGGSQMKKPTPFTQVGKLMKRATTICISAFLLVGYICASSGISAQSDQPARAKVHLQEHIPPGNYWRQEAVNVATQADTVPPDIRKIRDSYWNLLFPKPKGPFGVSIIDGGSIYSGSQKPSNEFPGVRKHPWFIGRFESFHVYQIGRASCRER